MNTAEAAMHGAAHQLALGGRRIAVLAVGMLLTAMLYRMLRRFDGAGISIRLAVAFTVSMPQAALLASFDYYSFVAYFPVSLFKQHPSRC